MGVSNEELYEIARETNKNAYAPYSKFSVSSAVLTKDGTVFTGTNVENASYGLTICAERTALGAAISAGHRDIIAIAIYVPVTSAPPCGACRQYIIEFGDNIDVIFKYEGDVVTKKISELLPYKFEF